MYSVPGTHLGGWLRRHRLDELPQFWNVLRGDMSLIGPRPEQTHLASVYAEAAPAFALRHRLRPGMTGWAQVNAPYAAGFAATELKLSYDLFYLQHGNLALDLAIVWRTLGVMATDAGAR